MLGNFFKPKWLHKDAKVRIQAIQGLAGNSVELIRLAQTDPDMGVRSEAITRLSHLPTLIQLGHGATPLADRARQRVIILAATDHHHDILLADVFSWLQNPALLTSIARDNERGVKLRRHALEQLNDQNLLFEIASNDVSKEIQYLAATRLHDLDKLKLLDKQLGKTNKRLRQLLKERIDQEQHAQQIQQRIATLCDDAESLGKRSTWAQEKTRALTLQQRWQETAQHANPAHQTRFDTAIQTFQQQLTTYETEQAQRAKQQAQQAAEQARIAAEAAALAEQQAQAAREQQEQMQQAQAQVRQQRQQQQAQQSELQQHLHQALQALEAHLEAERYGEAIDQHQSLLQTLKETTGLPAGERAFFQRRIQMLTPYIRELQDWRRWGTDQVRKQLIETAEHLRTDDALDPQERAKQVQTLRNEWRKLSQMEPGQQRALWKAFDANVTAAYEPSKQHFNEQAQQRQAHLEQRNTLCAQLEALHAETDWDNADWRTLNNQINQLRKQWKEAGTVGHKDWKTVNDRFNAAMDLLETPLKTERERNWQEREQLVATAKNLLEQTDTAQAIEDAKNLQTQWRISLPSRPADEQRLWKQFREPIDALFARSREERQQQRQERDAHLAETTRLEAEKRQRELEQQQQKRAAWDTLIAQGISNKSAETDSDTQQANQTAGEKLCLQLEILLDLETPAAFQQARMEYQLAQLSESMLSRRELQSPTAQALPLLKQWYALGGMAEEAAQLQTLRIEKIHAQIPEIYQHHR
ncbi:DUF349 domain-containing protein [Candidatus Thiothrix anitrata]|uniref:DUF349 domain-containing protein n=1 Tax=Candidatus Thiothrix anitrata TaxID=2823902 RepID=A0ABX7X0G7_9GAMM|nr:DUF349 domain-containing protein [Candidatus Thiothrix anitrata]QTR49451.1 DUF349 domain-containing protein [Candidatus Thiothrix anitrata]